MSRVVTTTRGFKYKSLVIVSFVLFLTFLDNTIVSVALSNIQSNLSAGVQAMQWIVDAYMLVFAVLMLTGGTLGDILGRKKIMLSGLAIFIIGSAVSFLAQSVDILIAGRIIMGIGAAASEPGTLSVLRHIYPNRKQLSRALGIWAAVSGIALSFGPIVGGVIIGLSNWRYIFLFNIILGIIILTLGRLYLPESSDPKGRSLDIKGLILGGTTITSTIFGFIVGESVGYHSWWIIFLFMISFIGLISFILVESKVKDPVLPLKYFRSIQFTIANIVAFITNFGIFAVFFFVALYLQLIAGFSGYSIALSFMTMSAAIVIASLISGKWNGAHQTSLLMIFGCLVAGVGIYLLSLVIAPNITVPTLSWVLALSGFGLGICLVTMNSSVLHIVPSSRSGMAASVVNTFRELGGVFGVAVLGSIVNGRLTNDLIVKLTSLGVPKSYRTLAVYAITHGGNTPAGVNVNPSILVKETNLVSVITKAAYGAFADGLHIALYIASSLLAFIGIVYLIIYINKHHTISDRIVYFRNL